MKQLHQFIRTSIAVAGLVLMSTVCLAQSHEWTEIRQIPVSDTSFSIWETVHQVSYPSLAGTDSVRIKDFLSEHRVTLLWYFASWCWNCNQAVSTVNDAYQDLKDRGFGILGIGVYSPEKDLRKFVRRYGVQFPIAVGPTRVKELDARRQTYHYRLRKRSGDTRTWGTPYHIFFDRGDSTSIYVGAGELREEALRGFLESHLEE